ncbi:uncharacterized protein LOC136767676 isoform X5 [Amia ocellicauda]|uniref:uncharacterized protein LOC136767676 isoform X5 n=1 Tax=Amia ocellicauda TaxID=2972642 RepID=UPI0034638716
MLTSVPTNGGVVIVTQMCPQGPGAVPIGAQQSGLPQGFTSPRDAALKRFVKGEPTALGYIVSGAVSIAGEKRKKNNICLDILRSLAWVMLFSSILEFCVAISVSAFGCKAVCNGSPAPVIVIQYGANSQPATQPSNPPGYQLAPDTEQDAFPKTPPPQYTE